MFNSRVGRGCSSGILSLLYIGGLDGSCHPDDQSLERWYDSCYVSVPICIATLTPAAVGQTHGHGDARGSNHRLPLLHPMDATYGTTLRLNVRELYADLLAAFRRR